MIREAYRQIPQSTVSDHLKFAMLRIAKKNPEIEFLEESHDSFLCQIMNNEETIQAVKSLITEELEAPIDFSCCSISRGNLTIPCEIKSGLNWKEMKN